LHVMPVCREKLGTADASVDAAKTVAPARAAVQRNLRMVILLFTDVRMWYNLKS
jgi:hypothetical protein